MRRQWRSSRFTTQASRIGLLAVFLSAIWAPSPLWADEFGWLKTACETAGSLGEPGLKALEVLVDKLEADLKYSEKLLPTFLQDLKDAQRQEDAYAKKLKEMGGSKEAGLDIIAVDAAKTKFGISEQYKQPIKDIQDQIDQIDAQIKNLNYKLTDAQTRLTDEESRSYLRQYGRSEIRKKIKQEIDGLQKDIAVQQGNKTTKEREKTDKETDRDDLRKKEDESASARKAAHEKKWDDTKKSYEEWQRKRIEKAAKHDATLEKVTKGKLAIPEVRDCIKEQRKRLTATTTTTTTLPPAKTPTTTTTTTTTTLPPTTTTTTTLRPPTTSTTTTLPPRPPSRGARLTVSVLDEATRRPVPNMRVDLTPLVGWKTFLRGPDRMVFEGLSPDSYSVTAEAEGYTSGSDRVTVTQQRDYSVVIWLKKKEEKEAPTPRLTARLDCGGSFELAPGASKSCSVIVEGWRSNTVDPVEVVFFPSPPPEGITVFPGNTSQDPGNMHSRSASDYHNRYVFSQGFQAKDNATPGTRQFQITVRQRGAGQVNLTLNVAVLKKGLLPSTGPGIRPPVTGGTGSGGEWCVWRYKPFGSPPQCFGFDEALCTSPRHNNPRNGYELERPNMTRYEAHALATQLSSYYDDKYACRTTTTLPSPAPPAQQTGSLTAELDCGDAFELAPGAFDGRNCGIVVRGWRSNTTDRVEVEVVYPRESSGIEVSPGNMSQDPGNMHSTSASDYHDRYVFGQTFRAKDNAPPGVTPIRITVRQRGVGQVNLTLNVAVIKKGQLASSGPGIRPPATVTTGSGGEYCVYRNKMVGDPPACFHFWVKPCGYVSPGYELVGQGMRWGEADARVQELSRYFDDNYGCRARITLPPTTTTTTTLPPTTTTTTTTTTLPPPQSSQRVLSRFGVFPYRVTLKVGETRSFKAHGVYSGGDPDKPVDLTGKASWSPGRVFTAKEPGEYTVTATFEGASDTATIIVEDEKKGSTDDGGKKPPDIKGATDAGTEFQGKTPGGKSPGPASGAAGGGQPIEQPGLKPPADTKPATAGTGGPGAPGPGYWCYSEKTKEQYWIQMGPCPPPWMKPPAGTTTASRQPGRTPWQGLVPGRKTPGTGTEPPPQKPSAPPSATPTTTLPPAKTPPTTPGSGVQGVDLSGTWYATFGDPFTGDMLHTMTLRRVVAGQWQGPLDVVNVSCPELNFTTQATLQATGVGKVHLTYNTPAKDCPRYVGKIKAGTTQADGTYTNSQMTFGVAPNIVTFTRK